MFELYTRTLQFEARAYEKHIWNCAFMLVGVKHGCTVGEVEAQHKQEVMQYKIFEHQVLTIHEVVVVALHCYHKLIQCIRIE
jgi:uncharacterized membrane protein YsdA (DUF1294 family)